MRLLEAEFDAYKSLVKNESSHVHKSVMDCLDRTSEMKKLATVLSVGKAIYKTFSNIKKSFSSNVQTTTEIRDLNVAFKKMKLGYGDKLVDLDMKIMVARDCQTVETGLSQKDAPLVKEVIKIVEKIVEVPSPATA